MQKGQIYTNIYVKVLCLVIVHVNVTKYMPQKCQIWQICGYQVRFFQPPNIPKLVFGQGSAPDPAGGAYDAPPDPLVGWGGGHPLLIPFPLVAFGVSVVSPPTQIPGYAYETDDITGPYHVTDSGNIMQHARILRSPPACITLKSRARKGMVDSHTCAEQQSRCWR